MTDPQDLPRFIIHLERAIDRKEQVERLRTALGPLTHIVPAVDGWELDDKELLAMQGKCPTTRYPFALLPAEVATFLSHRACWRKVIDEGHDAALVLEDDVELTAYFEQALALACSHLGERSFVRFPVKRREIPSEIIAVVGQTRLFRPKSVALGMQAQIVTRGAAERLLVATQRFDRPVDTFLQLTWVHHADVLCLLPSGFREISTQIGGSSIQRSLPPLSRICHELLRPIYRAHIAFHAWRFRGDM
jgi:GR25 family glycosyltransferase involved in LPS biosynthesis